MPSVSRNTPVNAYSNYLCNWVILFHNFTCQIQKKNTLLAKDTSDYSHNRKINQTQTKSKISETWTVCYELNEEMTVAVMCAIEEIIIKPGNKFRAFGHDLNS